MNVQPYLEQGNFTQFHNANFDHLMPLLSGSEWKVLCFIIRKTKGWQKEEDDIAYSQFRKGTGIGSNTTIKKALANLVDMGIIQQGKPAHKADPYGYRLNKSYSCRVTENDTPSTKKWTTGVSESVNTKDTNTKESIKEKEITLSPIEELVEIFKNETHLRVPSNGKFKTNWLDPIVDIYKSANDDFEATKIKIVESVQILRDGQYTIASPASIQTTAVNLYVVAKTPQNETPEMVYDKATDSYKRVMANG